MLFDKLSQLEEFIEGCVESKKRTGILPVNYLFLNFQKRASVQVSNPFFPNYSISRKSETRDRNSEGLPTRNEFLIPQN